MKLTSLFENLLNPFPDASNTIPPKKMSSFLWYCIKGARFYILLILLVTLCIGIVESLLFVWMGNLVEWLSDSPDKVFHDRGSYLLVIALIILFSPLLYAAQSLIRYQVLFANLPMRLRWLFHGVMLRQSMKFYQDEFAGRVTAKIMQSALSIRDFWMLISDVLVYASIYFITMTLSIGSFDWKISLPFIAWLVLYLIMLYYFIPKLLDVSSAQADARSVMTGRISDAYSNIMTVKLFSHAGREEAYAQQAMKPFLQAAYRQGRLITGINVCNHLLTVFLILSTSFLVISLWNNHIVGVGAVAAAIAMASRLNGISHWILWEATMLFEHLGTIKDGIDTVTKPIDVVDMDNAPALSVQQGDIQFKEVSFAYNPHKPLLEHFNLHIKAGEKVGLVGRSGAGKSSLMSILLRFYDIQKGLIEIDGQNIAHVTQDSLRNQIAMVTQDTALLHRSVRENILYGSPDASEEKMITASKQAKAFEFIQDLKDAQGRSGFDAFVGERGIKLSGGQRQRIAIARVLLKDAPILLLDEATSALDSESEVAIQESLSQLMQGKTVLAIAHRLSTLAAMDRIVVMDKGKIVEQGTHQELLALNGIYAHLWRHQSGGFLPEEDEEN
ncbi:multidrug ABC transporter ATP-binding protein [Basilea psittacipulmonis DSM 24701]|uniref:Multidrug ABC transporter ATP-binding protein n=2 Tax=Basilea TaxID=1472344 RepID=A0A077DFK1_9BURK|nr:multidrug ABC transporter ATP-binding protein [Basilea psittacipulmonis DSM 24701]